MGRQSLELATLSIVAESSMIINSVGRVSLGVCDVAAYAVCASVSEALLVKGKALHVDLLCIYVMYD